MADNNNQRAQNFEHGLKRNNIDKVSFRSSKADQVQLLDDIREIVAGGMKDLYGGQDDPRYIYIVNLIVKRIKAVLSDLNVGDGIEEIKALLQKNLDSNSQDKVAKSVEDIIASKLDEYNTARKAEYDSQKSVLQSIFDTTSSIAAKKQEQKESKAGIATEDKANAKDKSSELKDAVESQKTAIDVALSMINASMRKGFTAVNKAMSSMKSSIATGFNGINANLVAQQERINNAISQSQQSKFDDQKAVKAAKGIDNVINAIDAQTKSISKQFEDTSNKIDVGFKTQQKTIAKANEAAKKAQAKAAEVETLRSKDQQLSIRRALSATSDAILGATKNLLKGTVKSFKKIAGGITAVVGFIGKLIMGALAIALLPIKLTLKVLTAGLSIVLKPLKWFLKLFTSPIKLMLFLAGGMFILYKFFRPTFDKIVNKVSKIVAKVKDIYVKKVKPAVDIVKNIMGDSKLPLGKRIMTAATEGGKALYNNFFPNGISAFFGDLWSNTLKPGISKLWSDVILPGFKGKVLPFLKDTVWPFVKSNWKPILAGIGMAWLIGDPLGPIKAILTAIKGISIAIKIATVTGKVIKSGLGIAKGAMSLLSALGPPGWIAIAIVSAVALIAYGLYKALDSAKKEAQDAGKELYDSISARDTDIQKKLNSISENQNKMFDEFGDVLEKAGIKKPEELSPQVYELEDGTLVGKDQIDAMIQKVNAKKNSAIEQLDKHMQNGGFEDLDRHAAFSQIAVFNSYYAQARALVASVRSTLNAYAKDPVLQNDANLLKRYTAAQNIITKTESFVATEFAKMKEQTHGTTMGMLKSLALRSTTDKTRQQGQQLIDNIKSQLQQALVTMVQLDDSGKTAVAGVNAKKLASEMLNNIDAKVEGAIESKDQKVIQDMINGANATLSTIGTRMNAALKAQEKDLDKFLKEAGLDKQNTTVANEMKDQLKKLSDVAAHAHMAKNGIQKLDKETSRQIYEDAMLKLYKQKKEQLAKNPNDVALKKVVESLEKNLGIIKQHKDFTDQTSQLKGNLEKELAANNLDLTKEDANVKEGIDAALKQAFTKGDLNGISDIKQMSKDKQQAFLEDMKKQLAGQKVDDKKTDKIMEALNKLLTNTEEIKNKPAGDVTVVNSTTNVKQDKNLAGLDA